MFSLLYQYGHNHCSSLQSVEPFCLANQLDKISGMDDDIIVECLSVCLCLEQKKWPCCIQEILSFFLFLDSFRIQWALPIVFKGFWRFSCLEAIFVFQGFWHFSCFWTLSVFKGFCCFSCFWTLLEKVGRVKGWKVGRLERMFVTMQCLGHKCDYYVAP